MKKLILFLILVLSIGGCVSKRGEISEGIPGEGTETQLPVEEIVREMPEQPEEDAVKEPPAPETARTEASEETDWPTFHGNPARTGFSASAAPSKPGVLWKWALDDLSKAGVDNFDFGWTIIDDDKVFLAMGNIFAIDLKTGKEAWSYSGEDNFYPMGLTAGDKKIFATVNDDDNLDTISAGHVYALDENTGKFLWKFKTEKGVPYSLPLWADDNVFVGDNSGQVYAIDGDSGELKWKRRLEGAIVIHSSPAFEGGMIFIGTEASVGPKNVPSYLYALDAKSGEVKWKYGIDVVSGKLNLIHSAPSVSDGVVYVGAENGYFYALSSKDGGLIWKQKIASGAGELIGTSAAAAIGYGKVFIGIHEGKFLALDQKNGEVIWEYPIGKGERDSSAVLADGEVCFGAGSYFYCFSEADGTLIWKERLGGSSGALASGILIVQNRLIDDSPQPQTAAVVAFSDEGEFSLG